MTIFGWFLFLILFVLVIGSIIFLNKYLTSIFNKKYFLFFIILGASIISTLFLVPKTYKSLILESDIEISEKMKALEKSKEEYENQKNLVDKTRIKQLKKERNSLKRQLKKGSSEDKQLKYAEIILEIERIPEIKSNSKILKKNIRKQIFQLRIDNLSMFVKNHRLVIFICISCLVFIFFILFIIGTVKKPALIKEYETEMERLKIEEEKKQKEKIAKEAKRKAEEDRKRDEKIQEIANYFYINQLTFLDVQNAYQIIQEYDETISTLNKEIHKSEKIMSESILDTDDLFDIPEMIGKKSRAKKSYYTQKDKLENFENQNKSLYLQKKAFVSALPKGTEEFCEKYGSEIINCINVLINKAKKEQEVLKVQEQQKEQARIEKIEQNKINQIKAVEENRKNENEISEKKQKETECSRKIHELESFTFNFQKFVIENKIINLGHLNVLEGILDKIEDLKIFIPESDINNIERLKKKILASFENAENKNDVQVNIDIIKDSFNTILG